MVELPISLPYTFDFWQFAGKREHRSNNVPKVDFQSTRYVISSDVSKQSIQKNEYLQIFKWITIHFFFRENFLQLDIFFRQLSYEQITQQKAYDIFALICKYLYQSSIRSSVSYGDPQYNKGRQLYMSTYRRRMKY